MRLLRYYGHSHADYIICKKAITMANRETLGHIVKMAVVMVAFLSVASFLLPFILAYRKVYFITGLLLIAMALAFEHLRFFKSHNLLSTYLLLTILYGFGIALAMSYRDQTSTVFNLLLVILPIFFIDNFLRMSLYTLTVSSVYCVMSYRIKLPLIASQDIFNCLCFYSISLMAHFYVNYRIVGGMISDRRRDDALVSYQKAQHELRARVQKDPLTGLYNRSAFIELAVLRLKECREMGDRPVLGILDLDYFKSINDTFGHQTGDQVLVGVAAILQKVLRDSDIVGRLGGDEYIFLMTDIGSEAAATVVLEQLLGGVTQLGESKAMPLHGSVGVVAALDDQDTFDNLYHKADIALYNAKNTGRNRYVFYGG